MWVSWCFECFFSSSSFFWLTFSLQSKLLHESVCACELALHFGWVSARPPCQPPPVQGRPGSGSLLSSASYRKVGGCNIPGAICNLACSGRVPSSSHRGRSRGGQRGAGEGHGAFAHTKTRPEAATVTAKIPALARNLAKRAWSENELQKSFLRLRRAQTRRDSRRGMRENYAPKNFAAHFPYLKL